MKSRKVWNVLFLQNNCDIRAIFTSEVHSDKQLFLFKINNVYELNRRTYNTIEMCELLELCVPLCICMLRTFQFGLLGIGCIFHAIDECCIKPCCPNCCREKKKAISQEDVRVSSLEMMDFHGLGYQCSEN